jgi:hypothetical protein
MVEAMARSWMTIEQIIEHSQKEMYSKEEIQKLMKKVFKEEVDNTFCMEMERATGGWAEKIETIMGKE